jgi:ribonuclease HI
MAVKENNEVFIYTDGACDPNPGRGGWGAIILENGKEKILKGYETETTNNRMELTAALRAIQAVKEKDKRIVIFTDSQYLKMGIEEWMPAWIARNWKRKGGALANVDLWQALAKEIEKRDIHWKWVRGHAGHHFNERVDRIAREAGRGK